LGVGMMGEWSLPLQGRGVMRYWMSPTQRRAK